MEKIQERALKCVYSNHTASYESLLNKARLPSLEVGRQMNIAIQTFKILNDLAPPYLLELIEKRIENNQKPQNFQRWPASLFFHLIDSKIRCRSLENVIQLCNYY